METAELTRAIVLIESGAKHIALPIIAKILANTPKNEKAWFYLAYCVDDEKRKLECIKRILEINPENVDVKSLQNKKSLDSDVAIRSNQNYEVRNQTVTEQNHNVANSGPMDGFDQITKEKNTLNTTENVSDGTLDKIVISEVKEIVIGSDSITSKKKEMRKRNRKKNEFVENQIPSKVNIYGFKEGINQSSRLETGIFGKTTIVDGLKISPYEGPPCLRGKTTSSEEYCGECDYFSPKECLLRFDDNLFEDLNRFVKFRLENQAKQVRRSLVVSRIIHNELKTHGRPLHYSIVFRIISDRHPKLHLTEKSVCKFMSWHPELFECIEEGIYRAK